MNTSKIIDSIGLTFDDVLLLPNYTEIKRDEIDLATNLTPDIKLQLPFLSSPMDTVTASPMAIALGKLGGLGVLHRNMSIESQAFEVRKTKKELTVCAAAVGVGNDLSDRTKKLVSAGVDILVIDSAHGFSKWVIEATEFICSKYKNITLVAGSVATSAGAKALIAAGADVLRVGMGPGSICTTRIVAGIGVPQVTAILDTVAVAKSCGVSVIADGGLRSSGDIVKAISCGAASVMSGSLFAGTLEAPGKVITKNGIKYKSYRGMGSVAAMRQGSAARYGQNYRKGKNNKLVAEGIEGLVPYRGTVEDVVTQLAGGLRSGMYYTGVKNIMELQDNTRLMRVTQASLLESQPHDIIINN